MIEQTLRKFDTVYSHIFEVNRGRNNTIPPFMDFENMEKARSEAMMMFYRGNLNDMYERIIKGAV